MWRKQRKNRAAGGAGRSGARARQNAEAPPHLPATFSVESAAVHAVLEADEAASSPVSVAARDAFVPVHRRLMNAIEEENPARVAPMRRRLTDLFERVLVTSRRASSFSAARYAVALLLFIAVGAAGQRIGREQGAQALPVQLLVDDFDSTLKSAAPLEFVAADSKDAKPVAHWLSARVGHKVLLPAPARSGTRILGARHHELWGHSVAQAHYMKNGVHVALYQIHEPRAGLKGLQETEVNGRTYLAAQRGHYRVVVWRKGDDIVTMVSPLEKTAALRLAVALRAAAPKV
jgi:hypothetical protein